MGEWNETCIMTGLPIHNGDNVVAFIIESSSYNEVHDEKCVPISFGIRGKYNGVGYIDDISTELTLYDGRIVNSQVLASIQNGSNEERCYVVFIHEGIYDAILNYERKQSKLVFDKMMQDFIKSVNENIELYSYLDEMKFDSDILQLLSNDTDIRCMLYMHKLSHYMLPIYHQVPAIIRQLEELFYINTSMHKARRSWDTRYMGGMQHFYYDVHKIIGDYIVQMSNKNKEYWGI